jgi:hypothetical protein
MPVCALPDIKGLIISKTRILGYSCFKVEIKQSVPHMSQDYEFNKDGFKLSYQRYLIDRVTGLLFISFLLPRLLINGPCLLQERVR